MSASIRRLIHAYPNTALFSLGFLLVVIPETLSKAVFRIRILSGATASSRGIDGVIHYQQWPDGPPLFVKLIDFWRWLEHTTPYMAVAISAAIAGVIVMLIAYVRWVRGGTRAARCARRTESS